VRAQHITAAGRGVDQRGRTDSTAHGSLGEAVRMYPFPVIISVLGIDQRLRFALEATASLHIPRMHPYARLVWTTNWIPCQAGKRTRSFVTNTQHLLSVARSLSSFQSANAPMRARSTRSRTRETASNRVRHASSQETQHYHKHARCLGSFEPCAHQKSTGPLPGASRRSSAISAYRPRS